MTRGRSDAQRVATGAILFILLAGACRGSSTDDAAPEPEGQATTTTAVESPSTSSPTSAPDSEVVELVMESWNPSAEPIWTEFTGADNATRIHLLPNEAADFDGILEERLDRGLAGDLIACRPFDRSLTLYEQGHLADVSSLDLSRIPDSAFEAWTAPDGTRYCVPVSSVAFGFFYNVDIFNELGLVPPTTMDEFDELLQAILDDGRYIPLGIGSESPSRAGNFLFGSLGPAYWGGEQGRLALADGTVSVTDTNIPELFSLLSRWRPYLPEAHELLDPSTAEAMFATGEAAISPNGSWRLPPFMPDHVDFELGIFPTPGRNPGDPCAVVAPLDLAFGMNPATEHPERSMEFLQFVASEEFAQAYAETVVGQFPLQQPISDQPSPVETEMANWSERCDVSLRLADTGYGPGARSVHEAMWDITAGVIQGAIEPDEAATQLQAVIDAARSGG